MIKLSELKIFGDALVAFCCLFWDLVAIPRVGHYTKSTFCPITLYKDDELLFGTYIGGVLALTSPRNNEGSGFLL